MDVDFLVKIKAEQISRAERSSTRIMEGAGGYLDFLTDKRNRSYLKFYVGQSRDLLIRIHEHYLRLTRGDVSSLHYYICALGGENRSFNFIRLFRSPRDFCSDQILTDEDISMFMNVFEAAFGLAFGSLPGNVHDVLLGDGARQGMQMNMHLNVLNPLEQRSRITPAEAKDAREQMNSSTDPEIQGWVSFRQEVLRLSPKTNRKFVSFAELRATYLSLMQKDFPMITNITDFASKELQPRSEMFGVQEACQKTFSKVRKEHGLDDTFEIPVGSLSRSLAVVYGFSKRFSRSEASIDPHNALHQFLLDKVGLTPDNSLVWSSNFGLSSASETSDSGNFRSLCSDLDDLMMKMLAASSAKVIVVCGKYTQQLIQNNAKRLEILGPYQMRLSHQEVSISFDADKDQLRRICQPEKSHIYYNNTPLIVGPPFSGGFRCICSSTIYIHAPELFDVLYGNGWVRRRKMSLCLKLAAMLLKAENLNYRFYEIANARAAVFNAIIRERRGGTVTPASVEEIAKDWLCRQGFESSQDLTELADINSGLLCKSLHMLLFVLTTAYHRENQAKQAPPGPEKAHTSTSRTEGFPQEKMDAVRQLWLRKMEKKYPEKLLPSAISGTLQEQREKEELRQEMADDALLGKDLGQEVGQADIEIALETEKDIFPAGSWSDYNSISREDGITEIDKPVADAEAQVEKEILRARKRIRRNAATNRITAEVRALVNQGLSFEQVRQELQDCAADTVRRPYYRKDVLGAQLPRLVGGDPPRRKQSS